MSILKDLRDVYDANEHLIGKEERKGKDLNLRYMLLPVFHNSQKAHIEVTISESGDFITATVLQDGVTLIPVTLNSISRSSDIAPHSLHDKLIYLDPHYSTHLKESQKPKPYFETYLESLAKWKESSYTHPFLEPLYQYLSKGTLISDLANHGDVLLNEEGYFLEKWTGEKDEKPPIFNEITGSQANAFVRFRILKEDGEIYEPWKDVTIWEKHIHYQFDGIQDYGLCYVTGEETKLLTKHPKYIRSPGDKGKLISKPPNDDLITYQGLFLTPEQAVGIGAETSLKAHNALKWLIDKQGHRVGDSTYLVFGSGNVQPQMFFSELDELFLDEEEDDTLLEGMDTTEEILSHKLHALMLGFQKEIPEIGNNITIMCLDAATDGRLAITELIQLDTQLYFEHLKKWELSASWPQRIKGKMYCGSPSVYNISRAAYGEHIKDQVLQKTVKRLIPSILEQQPIPQDIVSSVVHRAIKHHGKNAQYEKRQAIEVACSLIKHNHGGEMKMELDTENTNRSYLFGRLLAIAEYFEGTMIEWSRETNAEKLMQMMYHAPANTWTHLQFKLRPYFLKKSEYKGLQIKCKKMIEEVIATLGSDFNNQPLSPEFLVGYSTQKREFFKSVKKTTETNN